MSETVRSFLGSRIGSYEQLDALLLLYANSERRWSPGEVATALQINDRLAVIALSELREHELIEEIDGPSGRCYTCSPNEELRWLVGLVARAYAEDHVEVVRLMSSNSIARMRAAAAKTFAEAFLFRREGDA